MGQRWKAETRKEGGFGGRYQRMGSGKNVKQKAPHLSIPLQSTKLSHRRVPKFCIIPTYQMGGLRPREKGPILDHTEHPGLLIANPGTQSCHASFCPGLPLSCLPPTPKGAGFSSQGFLRIAEGPLTALIYDFLTASFLLFPFLASDPAP